MTNNDDRGAALPLAQDIDSAYPLVTRAEPPCCERPGDVAAKAISDVLGWKWRTGDTKGFVAALTGSFELKRVEGHTEASWTPRGYAIQADLGAVTGAQASLAARARSAIKDATALLDSLRPLRPGADPENGEGFRSLVRHELEEIRKELESPLVRVPRIDQLFLLLLGNPSSAVDPNLVRGHLGQLRDEFGLIGSQVNTIEEERIQTSFITLVDWVLSLYRGWLDARSRIDPFAQPDTGQAPFFGPTVVALSQLLSAAAVQTEELVSALSSVSIHRGDREVLQIPDPAGGSMSLGGLLRWVRDFVAFEGRKLIESAGKDGVHSAFLQIAERLERIVGNLPRRTDDPRDVPGNYRATLPPGFFSSRVQRAIDELHDHLQEIVRIARPVRHDANPPGRPAAPPEPTPPGPMHDYGPSPQDSTPPGMGPTEPTPDPGPPGSTAVPQVAAPEAAAMPDPVAPSDSSAKRRSPRKRPEPKPAPRPE
ncbi:hypothetical protein [Saccharopolyspora phatthalungensis]|uniref:Uncharacterized protein n=1 Tax=Saccharopolyspora phatthalungensis TaxID=664693 RepID=A0A840Q3F6_9PSEU|nr:hypothetical protein [Saccharopolyspora phatthalungensis]MBB5155044.1 hypothetical protein [Saccharopolyspora phatthalungensis]